MSTRSVIAFALSATRPEEWEGRYHHWDGYPTSLGAELFKLFQNHFHGDIKAMRRYLYADHPAGWSTICGGDFNLPPGYVEDTNKLYQKKRNGQPDFRRRIPHGPRCFCHGDRHEKQNDRRTHLQEPDDCEWGYVLTAEAHLRVLAWGDKKWQQVADVDLNIYPPTMKEPERLLAQSVGTGAGPALRRKPARRLGGVRLLRVLSPARL